MVLVDSSVLLDILTIDPRWYEWSAEKLDAAAAREGVAINAIIYAEVSVRFSRIEELEAMLHEARLPLLEIPHEALFLAAKAFVRYRREGGSKTAPLPDFFIGAHAAVSSLPLLTRDPGRIRSHFPMVRLITPTA